MNSADNSSVMPKDEQSHPSGSPELARADFKSSQMPTATASNAGRGHGSPDSTGVFRPIRMLATALVAGITAWSSYWHMVHVALRYGERSEVAYVLPLSVDGLLTISAIVMADDRRAKRPVRRIAKLAFLIGLTASIAANVAGAQPTLGGRLVAAWPAIALLLIVEMLTFVRDSPTPADDIEPSGEQALVPANVTGTPTAQQHGSASDRKFPPEPPHEFTPEDPRPTGTSRRRQPTSITRKVAAEILTAEPDLTRDELAARIGISTRRLRVILASPDPS